MRRNSETSNADRRRAGFSLLEVLIAMMILSIGAASVLSLFAAAASTHKRGRDRTHAALVAERIFGEVKGRYSQASVVKKLHENLKKELPARFGDYAWELFMFKPGEEGKTSSGRGKDGGGEWGEQELFVRVLVRWKQSGNARVESFFTILLPRNTGEEAPSRQRKSNRLLGGRR